VVPTASVEVATARARPFVETITVQGHTAADSDLTYSAEVPGTVESLRLRLGQRVRRGQVLARIDYRSLSARAEAARARHELQRKTHGRLVALREGDVVAQDGLDRAVASLAAARAELKIARANLDKAVIRARRSGVVTHKFVESGEYVAPGAPVVQVVNLDRVVVEGQLPESRVAAVRPGAAAQVEVRALGLTVPGEVAAVLPVAAPVSRTFRFRLRLPNPGHRILVGMAATVKVAVKSHEGVVMVPQDVVLEEPEGRAVYLVGTGDVAVRRMVTLGPTDADRVVLRSGIQPGERLVVLGHRTLSPGQPLKVVRR